MAVIPITYKINGVPRTINYDGTLLSNLNDVRVAVRKSGWDCIALIVGRERGGKSTIGMQMAKYWDKSFNIDRVVFTPEQFEEAVKNAKKFQAIVWDEAIQGAMSAESRNSVNLGIKKMLAQIGQKNLFIIAIMPNFWDFERYIAVHRSYFLIKTEVQPSRKGWKRGFFRFYNDELKKDLYITGKTNKERYTTPNFWGRFGAGYTVDEKAYIDKKLRYGLTIQKQTSADQVWRTRWTRLVKHLAENKVIKHSLIAEISGMTQGALSTAIKDLKDKGMEVKRGRKKKNSEPGEDATQDTFVLEFPEAEESQGESLVQSDLSDGGEDFGDSDVQE